MNSRLVYIYLLNVPSFSSRYFNKIKRTSRLGRLLALSLEILQLLLDCLSAIKGVPPEICSFVKLGQNLPYSLSYVLTYVM